jgi:hypothetical protein
VIFSELPKNDKMKYFKFLLENDINFTRDENGYYVALVKVLNPNFYGGESKPKDSKNLSRGRFEDPNTSQDEMSEVKPRSGSQIHSSKKVIRFEKNTIRSRSPMSTTKKSTDKQIKRELVNYNDQFNLKYNLFISYLRPLVGVRGKRINLYQLKYFIEELYSVRFIKDTSSLKHQLTRQNEIEIKESFPIFVVDFLLNKFVKKHMVDQNALDILLSCDYFKDYYHDINIFAKFLNEEYDTDDLIFFLFVRSCIEKEMKFTYIEKSRDDIKLQYQDERDDIDTEVYLNVKTCLKSKNFLNLVANNIFGNEDETLLNSFMEKIEKNLVTRNGRHYIKASVMLEITLNDYHHSRALLKNEQSIQVRFV